MTLGSMLIVTSLFSFIGIVYIIYRKLPALMLLPEESLTYKETFIQFMERKTGELPLVARGLHIGLLKSINKRLLKSKVLSLKIHNKMHAWTEVLNQKLHHKKTEEFAGGTDEGLGEGVAIATMASTQDDRKEL
jgi:hypothetical protein